MSKDPAVRRFRKAMADRATRDPRPPPFQVGVRLRCIVGPRHDVTFGLGDDQVRVFGHGLEVVVDEVRPGRRGTGRWIQPSEVGGDDDEEPFQDETRDGYCVYHVTAASGKRHGRCISWKCVGEWEVIEAKPARRRRR